MTLDKNGNYRIRTPENIELTFQIAGIGRRVLAHMVDVVIVSSLSFTMYLLTGIIIFVLTQSGANFKSLSEITSTWLFALVIIVSTLLNLGYYLFFEVRWQGQTPGKRWSQLRVIKDNGQPLDFQSAFIRNLIRLVDQTFLLGFVVVLFNGREKRLGDFAAGTLVIQENTRQIQTRPTIPDATVPFINLNKLSPQDFLYIEEYLNRRTALSPSARQQVSQRLAQRYRYLLGDDNATLDADTLLELLHSSYLRAGQE